jgi:predicted permease
VRQLLVESLTLAAAGGVFGVLLANWLLTGLLALYPQRLPVWQTITIDAGAAMYGLVLVVVAGFLIGLVPALHATGVRTQETLKADARVATATRAGVFARSALVVGQLALSVVLLAAAILLVRSYQHLQRVDLGIDPAGVLTFTLSVPPARQPDDAGARQLLVSIEERLAAVPGIEAVGLISALPLNSAGPPDDFIIDGRAAPQGGPAWNARYLMATPGTFRALRVPLRRGRLLTDSDAASQPLVAVINETAARTYWPGDDPVGRTIRYYPRETSPAITIVGVVGDVRSAGPNTPAPPAVYVPYEQAPRPAYAGRTITFLVRGEGNPNELVATVRTVVASVDAALPLASVRPMSDLVSSASGEPRFTMIVMTLFAAVAFFLAALGLYGILAYSVEQRIREIGVRIALGAGNSDIFRLIIGNGVTLALLGIVVGIPSALTLTRFMRDLLAGVSSSDPITYTAVVVVFVTVACLASYLPARRATRVNTVVALRQE